MMGVMQLDMYKDQVDKSMQDFVKQLEHKEPEQHQVKWRGTKGFDNNLNMANYVDIDCKIELVMAISHCLYRFE